MLARFFGDGPSCQFVPGLLAQPKLNGVRCLVENGAMLSRDGHRWHPSRLPALRRALDALPRDVTFDGELYRHGESLAWINSRVAVNRIEDHPEHALVEYHVFDVLSRRPMFDRIRYLAQLARTFSPSSLVRFVPTYVVRSRADADTLHLHWRSVGYEGSMYRRPFDPYPTPRFCSRADLRVPSLLKRKDWLDITLPIVGMRSGTGKHAATMSCFVLRLSDGRTFEVSSGPSDAERALYHAFGSRLLGQMCRIEYRELTLNGIPFHTRIECVELPPH